MIRDTQPEITPAGLTPTQAARYAGVSRSTLDRWRKEAGLRSIRIGGRVIIRRETLDAYLSELEAKGEAVDYA